MYRILLGCTLAITAIAFYARSPKATSHPNNPTLRATQQKHTQSKQLISGQSPSRPLPQKTSLETILLTPDELSLKSSQTYVDQNGYGYTQPITNEKNEESPQLASVTEALQAPTENASRLSAAIAPKAFNKDSYLSDPSYKRQYLLEVEPGRAFLVDPDSTHRLERLSKFIQTVEQGNTVKIQVRALAGAPVSITSFDLGKLGNHLTYQTVEADSSGIATFTFHGVEGTIEDTNLLIASPMSANNLKFIVNTQISKQKIQDNKGSE